MDASNSDAPTPAGSDLPGENAAGRVMVELDSGPFEAEFFYVPVGQPAYSDVSGTAGQHGTFAAAEMAGFRLLAVGNWQSFTIEKRYAVPSPSARSTDG